MKAIWPIVNEPPILDFKTKGRRQLDRWARGSKHGGYDFENQEQFHNHAGTARLEEITLPGNRLSVLSVTTVDDKMFSLRTANLVFLSSGIRKTERVESQMKPRKPKTGKE